MSLRHLSTHLIASQRNQPPLGQDDQLHSILSQMLGNKQSTPFPEKPAVIKSDKPFFIMLLNKKCCGCGQLFRDTGSDSHVYTWPSRKRLVYPSDNKWNVGSLQNKTLSNAWQQAEHTFPRKTSCNQVRQAIFHYAAEQKMLWMWAIVSRYRK